MGFNLNPFHDVKEAANDALGGVSDAVTHVAHDVNNDVLHPIERDVAAPVLNALNVPLSTVQHVYRTEHDVWTRYGVGAFLQDNTYRLIGGAVDKNLDPQINEAWERTGSGGTGLSSLDTTNPNYRDIHGNAVNPGFDVANIVDNVVNGHDYMPAGWTRDKNGVMQPTQGGGVDFLTGAVNAAFDLGADPLLAVGKVQKAVKAGGMVIRSERAGAHIVQLSDDVATRADQIKRLSDTGVPMKIAADGKTAVVGGRVLVGPRVPTLYVKAGGHNASDIPMMLKNNPAVRDSFGRIAAMKTPEEIFTAYPSIGPTKLAQQLSEAKTPEEVGSVFEDALTTENYKFGPKGLPATGLVRRVAASGGLELPTLGQVGTRVADSNSVFRKATSYRANVFNHKTLEMSEGVFDPNDPNFPRAFRDTLLAVGHNRRVANAITGAYLNTPDLGSRVHMISNMMTDALRTAGLADDHDLIAKYGKVVDFLNKNSLRRVYGMGRDGEPIYVTDPMTDEPMDLGLFGNQVGKIALPNFNEVRKAVAETKGGLGKALVKSDDWLYNTYTGRFFKGLVLLSMGFPFRVATGEITPAILANSAKEYAGGALEGAAARFNPTFKDLSHEYGPEALIDHRAEVTVDGKERVGRIASVDPQNDVIQVAHRDGTTSEHALGDVTVVQKELRDGHIMKMAKDMGIEVDKRELGHIRGAMGMALHRVGRALVDEDYYNAALRNILTLDGHILPTAVASNHDVASSMAGRIEDLKDQYKQAGARYPEKASVLSSTDWRAYDAGLKNHPIFWNHAIHEASGDEGVRLGANAYHDAIKAGKSEQEATKAFIDVDLKWMREGDSDEAQTFRENMALYGKNAPEMSRGRAEAVKGLAYGKNGKLNDDVIASIAGNRGVPSIGSLASRRPEFRPLRVKGREVEPVMPPNLVDRMTQRGWRSMHPIINGLSRQPIYTMLTAQEYKGLKSAVDLGTLDVQTAHRIAQVRAVNRMIPLIHNPRMRSQFADLSRNFFPFFYAQEQAYKRYGKAIFSSPLAFRKAVLAEHAISNSGVMRADAQGNQSIVLPGGTMYGRWVTAAASGFGVNVLAGLPSTISGDTISLKSVVPEGNLPSVSPLVAVGLEQVQHYFPASEPLISKIVGPINESQSITDQLIPNATLKRALQATTFSDRSTAFATAFMQNMASAQYRSDVLNSKADKAQAEGNTALAKKYRDEAAHWFPPADADFKVKQAAVDRLRNTTRIQMLVKTAIGLFSPLSPSMDNGDLTLQNDVRQELATNGVKGLDDFITKHPNATAYTVFQSDNTGTGTSLPATKAAYDWVTQNRGWIKNHGYAAAYLIPQTKQAYDVEAYNQELAMGLRTKRDAGDGFTKPGSYIEALYTAATDAKYYPSLDDYEKQRAALAGNDAAISHLDQQWQQYKSDLAAANPVWAANQPSKNPQVLMAAQNAFQQLSEAVNDPKTPQSPQTEFVNTLVESYNDYSNQREAIQVGVQQGTLTDLKSQFNDYLDQYAQEHPNATAVITGVFRRLVDASA